MVENKSKKELSKHLQFGFNFVAVHSFGLVFAAFEAKIKKHTTDSEIFDVLTASENLSQLVGGYILLMALTFAVGFFWSRGKENNHKRSYQYAILSAVVVTLIYALNTTTKNQFFNPDIIGLFKPYVTTLTTCSAGVVTGLFLSSWGRK